MVKVSQMPPNSAIHVSRGHLKQALDAMDVSDSALSKDGACLFCRDGQFVIRQGYTERTVPSENSFPGQFSIAFTSLQKWRRSQKAVAGDESLRFADGQLRVCCLELPTKWQPEVESLAHAIPKVVPPAPTKKTLRDDAQFASLAVISKTCAAFRVNADRKELQDALSKFATDNICDIQLRTWGGKLILSDGTHEASVDAEGKIDGFSVIPAAELSALKSTPATDDRFVNVTCEKHELRILGKRIKTPKKAVQYPKVP